MAHSCITLFFACIFKSSSLLTFIPWHSSYKDPWDYIEPTEIILHILSISRSLTHHIWKFGGLGWNLGRSLFILQQSPTLKPELHGSSYSSDPELQILSSPNLNSKFWDLHRYPVFQYFCPALFPVLSKKVDPKQPGLLCNHLFFLKHWSKCILLNPIALYVSLSLFYIILGCFLYLLNILYSLFYLLYNLN